MVDQEAKFGRGGLRRQICWGQIIAIDEATSLHTIDVKRTAEYTLQSRARRIACQDRIPEIAVLWVYQIFTPPKLLTGVSTDMMRVQENPGGWTWIKV